MFAMKLTEPSWLERPEVAIKQLALLSILVLAVGAPTSGSAQADTEQETAAGQLVDRTNILDGRTKN